MRAFRFAGIAFLLVTTLTGCPEETPAPGAPQIASFTAAPATALVGDTVTLSWTNRNTASIAIRQGDQALDVSGANPAAGTLEVVLDSAGEVTFTLVATGLEGADPATATATATVTVEQVDPPVIASFTATPASVPEGGTVVLAWEITGADAIAIVDDGGASVDVSGADAANGSVTVTPAADATYTLTATNAGGEDSAEATVVVLIGPVVDTFTADPIMVTSGEAVTLTWTTSNAASVGIVDDQGVVVVENGAADGSIVVNPIVTTSYTLTATGDSATIAADVTVQVVPVILAFTVDSTVVRAGDTVTLAWETEGAAAVDVSGPDGFTYAATEAEVSAGTTTAVVTSAGDFVLTAATGSLNDVATVAISLTDAPRVRSVVVTPDAVTEGHEVVVSWTVDGIDTAAGDLVELTVNGLAHTLGASELAASQATVTLSTVGTTSFVVTATSASGSHSLSAEAQVVAAATVASFVSLPSRVYSGGSVELTWATADAAAVRLEKDGVDLGITASLVAGSHSDTVTADAAYVLFAANALGDEVQSAPLTVTVGSPVIGSYAVTPNPAFPGEALAFDWTVLGAGTLTLRDDAAATDLHTTTSAAEIASGNFASAAPATVGTYAYTLTVDDGAGGLTTETVQLLVTDGPIVRAFTAAPEAVTLGETFTLSWQVDNAPDGSVPTLSLVDGAGTVIDLSGKDANADSLVFTTTAAGTLTLTLTASVGGTTDASVTVSVDVQAPPAIDTFAATPDSLDTQGGTLQPTTALAWTTHDAVTAELFELDASGSPVIPALFAAGTQAEVDAHSLTLTPAVSTRYRLTLANALGFTIDADVLVIVDGANISSFTVTAPGAAPAQTAEIFAGEQVELAWTTERADSVRFSPTYVAVTPSSAAFLDISGNAGATQIMFPSADDSRINIPFPAGFTFPFFGVDRTEMSVGTNGWISFDTAGTSSHSGEARIPSTGAPNALLAVLWDDLDAKTTGQGYWEHVADPSGDYLVVMWKTWNFYSSSRGPADLNFEAILYADGRFEYRYGTMDSAEATDGTTYANGADAAIGFENDAGDEGYEHLYRKAWAGGLSNQGWMFALEAAANGTWTTTPTVDTVYVLTATNANGEDTASVSVTVQPAATVVAGFTPAQPEVARSFDLTWTTTDATKVEVKGAAGAVLCSTVDVDQVAEGTCAVTEATAGLYSYTVEVTGLLARDLTIVPVAVQVYPALDINAFTVNGESPETFLSGGQSAVLAWDVSGAAAIRILEGTTDVTPVGAGATGTLTRSPAATTAYRLFITDDATWNAGRIETRDLTAYVNAAQVTQFGATSTQLAAGESTTLNWSTTNATQASLSPSVATTAGNTFTTLLGGTGVTEVTLTDLDEGTADINPGAMAFAFPFEGATYSQFHVSTNGWVQLGASATGATYTNTRLPDPATPNGLIAPFWEDLDGTPGVTKLLWKVQGSFGGRELIIEWHQFSLYDAAGIATFQLVLSERGTAEIRYLEMQATLAAEQQYYNGGWASVGWENMAGTAGAQIVFHADSPSKVGAGISHVMYLVVGASGSLTLAPTTTTTYELCVSGGGHTDCEQVTVVVVEPGDIMISELLANPAGTDTGREWFEVVNTTGQDIDLSGWVIRDDGTDTHTISALVVPAGGYAVLAQSADLATNGGVQAAYAYGTGFTLANTSDELVLVMNGVEIDRYNWTSGIVSAVSAQADPRVLGGLPAANDNATVWCASTVSFGDGTDLGTPGEEGDLCPSQSVSVSRVPALAIPDEDPIGVSDVATLTQSCLVVAVTVDVAITHGYIGDLLVGLVAPDGTQVVLHRNSGGSNDDIVGNYPATLMPADSLAAFQGLQGQGDWTLVAIDSEWLVSGTLDAWGLNFECF